MVNIFILNGKISQNKDDDLQIKMRRKEKNGVKITPSMLRPLHPTGPLLLKTKGSMNAIRNKALAVNHKKKFDLVSLFLFELFFRILKSVDDISPKLSIRP